MNKSVKERILMAIDPGCGGGIVVMRRDKIFALGLKNCPDSEIVSFLKCHSGPNTLAYLEKVGGFVPKEEGEGQPGSRMFTFGDSNGFLRGVLATLGVHLKMVLPQVWQRGLPKAASYAARKTALLAHAKKLFPTEDVTRETCDAFGILHYARFVEFGQNGGYEQSAEPVAKRHLAAESWCIASGWPVPPIGSNHYGQMLAHWEEVQR